MAEYQLADLPASLREHIEVDPASGCWLWRGSRDCNGYGYVPASVRQGGSPKLHRFVFTLLAGPIPAGLVLDHVKDRGCRSKSCCWPAHLEPVTRAENSSRNARDLMRRGFFSLKDDVPDTDQGEGSRS